MAVVAYAGGWHAVPESGYKYVRRVKELWQARPVREGGQSGSPRINLGLYPNPREAWQAVLAYARTGALPDRVLPTYVKPHPGGGYVGRVKRNGRSIEVGPVNTPEEASAMLAAKLPDLPPRPRRPLRPAPAASPAEAELVAAVRKYAAAAVGIDPAAVRVAVGPAAKAGQMSIRVEVTAADGTRAAHTLTRSAG